MIQLIFFLFFACSKPVNDFAIAKIGSDRPYNASWETAPLTDQEKDLVQKALNQKYHYFAGGAQVYVFFSEDQNYTLKFFKQKSYSPRPWTTLLPDFLKYKTRKIGEKQRRLLRDFNSYKLAFDVIRDDTGLLLVHLNKTKDLKTSITLLDKDKEYTLNLDDYDFILQRKAVMVTQRLDDLMKANDPEGAKRALTSLLELIVRRTNKGVVDRYPNLFKNFGFIGNDAIELDVGRFTPGSHQEGLPVLHTKFKAWLERYPALAAHWDAEFERLF